VRIIKLLAAFSSVVAIGGADPVAAETEDQQALTDLVQILKNEGVLDESQYNQLSAKAAKREAKESWTDRISLWGDFRTRWEGFYYNRDDNAVPNRSRFRYRFRLNGKARINPYAEVLFRLVSGGDDDRSTNRTLGDLEDFASDPIRIDRAYARLTPFAEGRLPDENGTLYAELGKVPNPFTRKVGKDYMLWDSDINLEGGSLLFERDVVDNVNVYVNTGFYIVQEQKASNDPSLYAVQLGTDAGITEDIDVGARISYFRFGNVDDAMLNRGASGLDGITSSGGNIFDGMTGGTTVGIIESRMYAKFGFFEDWPILVWGTVASNLSAQRSELLDVGRKDFAWGVGAEVGNKKKWVLLGMSYFDIQANSMWSQFTDSDVFDGKTNRKGFAFFGSKQVMKNTEIVLTTFWSRPSDDDPALEDSVPKANRVRVMADLKFKF
jgi:hypothetical protein